MAKSELPVINNGPKVKLSMAQIIKGGIIVAACTAGYLNLKQESTANYLDLKQEIRSLGVSRWTEVDDRIYMREFAHLNEGIVLPPHERVTTAGEKKKQ